VRWVDDLEVRGRVVWQRDTGDIQAALVARRGDGTVARLTIGWNDWQRHGRALVIGQVDRRPITATFPAP
jgi:hypothetical protein